MTRPLHPRRDQILTDLYNVELTIKEICRRQWCSQTTVYLVAKESGLDIGARSKIMSLLKQKRVIEHELRVTIQQFQGSSNAQY